MYHVISTSTPQLLLQSLISFQYLHLRLVGLPPTYLFSQNVFISISKWGHSDTKIFTFTSPPAGLCLAFSRLLIFDSAFQLSLLFSIYNIEYSEGCQFVVAWYVSLLWHDMSVCCGMACRCVVAWHVSVLWYGMSVRCGMACQCVMTWLVSLLWHGMSVLI